MATYYLVSELADITGLSQATIRHHCRRGRLAQSATIDYQGVWHIPRNAGRIFIEWVRINRGLAGGVK